MLRILAAKLSEKLPGLDLQIVGQRSRKSVCLFELNSRFTRRIDLEYDVAESLEVRIHRSVERNLGVRHREAPHMRIVITALDRADVVGARPAGVGESDEANIHVATGRARRSAG